MQTLASESLNFLLYRQLTTVFPQRTGPVHTRECVLNQLLITGIIFPLFHTIVGNLSYAHLWAVIRIQVRFEQAHHPPSLAGLTRVSRYAQTWGPMPQAHAIGKKLQQQRGAQEGKS